MNDFLEKRGLFPYMTVFRPSQEKTAGFPCRNVYSCNSDHARFESTIKRIFHEFLSHAQRPLALKRPLLHNQKYTPLPFATTFLLE